MSKEYHIAWAGWRISNGLPARKEAAMVKAWSGDAPKKLPRMAQQIHGAMGFTKDENLYLYFRYVKAGEVAFGDSNYHKEAVAKEMSWQKKPERTEFG